MPKIVFIGAGSFGFTRGLVRDLLTFPLLESSEIALVDINKQRLNFARRACQKIVDQGNYPATVISLPDAKGRMLYRVRVGGYPTREEAKRVAVRLESEERLKTWIP